MIKNLPKRLWLLATFGLLTVVGIIAHVTAVNSLFSVNEDPVAKIDETEYATLQDAINAAATGQTITLLNDITQDYGVLFDKSGISAKLNLDGKTLTVNNGSNVNNRAIKINDGTLEVYGGSIVAVGTGTNSSNGTGCYGAFRVEANGELIAHDLTLSNARPWGLNVKVLGGKAELTNVTINSSYGGGIEVTEADLGTQSKAGTATLTNCTINQQNYFDHCSTALSVSGGSELVVNSGTYTSENHVLYVFSSGGKIIVNDGTFKATGSKPAIIAAIDLNTYPSYTGGLQLKGGNYTGTYQITSPAYMEVTGGTYTTDPTAYVPTAEGYSVVENSGSWTVQADPVVTFLLRDNVGDMTIQYDSSVYTMHTQDGVQRSGAAVYNYMTQTVANGGTATEPAGEPSYWYHSGKTFPEGNNTGIPFTVEQSQAYVFDGWRLSGTNERYDFSTPVTSDITLVPHFSAVEAVFEIYTEADLFAFAREVALGRSYRSKWGGFPRQTVKLMNNITLTSNWTPIPGNFRGIFDGNGCAISGLVINDTNNETGFFRNSGHGGVGFEVKDLTFQSPSVTSTGSFIGVLVGQADVVTVTNVTINNPTVLCTSTDNVGGLVGSVNNNVSADPAAVSVFRGCAVNGGTISCTGTDGRMVGGLMGQALRYLTITDCSVTNVTINGYRKLGGLIGQANEVHFTVTDASVSGVTLNALGDTSYAKDLTMGGFVGQFVSSAASTFTGTVRDLTMTGPESIASGKNYIMGLVSGGTAGTVEAAETAMSAANMTFDVTISGTNTCTVPNESTYAGINGVPPVAKIGDMKYSTLAAAIAAVPTDGTATTITMLDNETVADGTTLTIPANKNIVLDLNGKTISGSSSDSGKSFYFLTNRGTLEITDNSVGALGKITYGCSSPNTGYSKEYVTIYNIGGTLTLTEGTVENRSGYLSYAINNSSNAWGNNDDKETVFTMTGGCISAPSGDAALRVYQNCAQNSTPFSHNTVNISGGKIKDTGIFLDNYIYQPNANTTGDGILTSVTISGGEIHGLIDLKLRHAFNTSLTITGGTFVDSKLWVRKHGEWNSVVAEPNAPIVHISGGKFSFVTGKAFGLSYDCDATSWTSYTQPYDVSGGVFNVDLNNFTGIAFPTGMGGVVNTDISTSTTYPYTVGVTTPVAQIGETTYTSLAAAITAANATGNVTITLLRDYDFETFEPGYGWTTAYLAEGESTTRDNMLEISGNGITFDLGGYTISNLFNNTFKVTGSNVTIQNGGMEVGQLYYSNPAGTSIYTNENDKTCSYVMLVSGAENFTVNSLTTFGGINVSDASTATINDLSFSGTKFYAVCSQENSTVTLNGGTYTKAITGATGNLFWIESGSTMNITGGTFTKGGVDFRNGNVNPVITGGTFDFDPSNLGVADGYEAVKKGNVWKVGEVVTGDLTPTQASETQATYSVEAKVMDGEAVLETLTPMTVNVAIADANVAEGATLNDLNMETVVAKSITEAPNNASAINVQIAVVATPETPTVENTLVFEVHPEATVFVNNEKQGTVELENEDLALNATFTFKLDVSALSLANGSQVKVVHKSSDPATYPDETFYATVADGKVSITVSHFSEFDISGVTPEEGKVAINMTTGTQYPTLQAAIDAATDGQTIALLADCQVTEAIVNTKNITLDLATYSISGTVAEYLLQNQGTLVINADADNPGKIYNVSTAAKGHGAVLNDATGTITINGGIFGDNDNDPTNTGTVNSGCALRNRGTATVNGGVFTTAEPDYSGSVWAYAIVSGESEVPANITINGGDIYGKHGDLCNNNGTMEIYNVNTYGTANYYSIYAWKSGTTTVNGGDFVKNGHASGASFQFYADEADANIIVKDGNFTKNTTGNFAGSGSGKVEISGGTFNKKPEDAIIATGYEAENIGQDTWTVERGNYVAKIGTTPYETLEAAIAAATEGANEIVLLTDIDLGTNGVTIAAEKNVILNLNNHDITGTVNGKLITNNGALTINGNGHVYNQDISAQGHDALLNNGTVTINGGTFGDSDDDQTNGNNYNRGAGLRNFGTAVLNGGKFTAGDNYLNSGWAYAIINGDDNNTPSLTINDGVTVYGANNGNIANNSGTTTVNGGTFSITGPKSHYNIYADSGTVSVVGGTFTKSDYVSGGSPYSFYPGANATISISDGSFTNTASDKFKHITSAGVVSVTGGTFNKQPEDAIIATGYEAENNGQDTWTVETIKVAQIGDVKYASLAEAIAAVTTSDATTIMMIADETVAENTNMTIAATKNIVLDLNGKTVTGSSSDSNNSFYFITNNGTLEITDSSEGAEGQIIYGCSSPNTGYSYEYVTIYNCGGTLTLTEGLVKNTSGYLSYAINNSSNAWGSNITSTFNMTGGSVSAPSGDAALRVYQNCAGGTSTVLSKNYVNISGGTIVDSGIFIDCTLYTTGKDMTGYTGSNIDTKINISGGTVNGLIDLKTRHPFNTLINITDGNFNNSRFRVRKGDNYAAMCGEPTTPLVQISGGKFSFADNCTTALSLDGSNSTGTTWTDDYKKAYYVSGGIFNKDLNTTAVQNGSIQFPDGKTGVANTDPETSEAYPYTVGESTEIIGDIILIDGEDYVFASDKTVTGQITYQRSFDSNHVGVYQSWLVPFDYVITAADVQKFQFYKINMVANSSTEGNAGNVNENLVFVHIKEMGAGEILRANKPYVIKTLDGYTTGEVINFVSITGTPLHGKRIDACNSTATSVATYDFYATYNPTTAQKFHDFLYISKLGSMSWANTVTIGSYRWIIKMTAKEEAYAPVFGFINDDGATDIRDAEFASDDDIEGYYTLNGVRVETPGKGVYIVKYNNGRTKKVNLK